MKENFNNAVYQDEEMSNAQKIELLKVCFTDYQKQIWENFKKLSPEEKTEMLWFITSAQLVILNRYRKEKNQ